MNELWARISEYCRGYRPRDPPVQKYQLRKVGGGFRLTEREAQSFLSLRSSRRRRKLLIKDGWVSLGITRLEFLNPSETVLRMMSEFSNTLTSISRPSSCSIVFFNRFGSIFQTKNTLGRQHN